MPYLRIQTNHSLQPEGQASLMAKASRTVAECLAKPEQYVMVAVEDETPMLFAASDAPAVYLELKSIGLPKERASAFSEKICGFVEQELEIHSNRVFIEFKNLEREMFGWNGKTF